MTWTVFVDEIKMAGNTEFESHVEEKNEAD